MTCGADCVSSIDQARAWTEATGGNLRQYLRWVRQQTAEGARVAEAVLPETDDDAVRIMTIHSAKGLEFPITIVSGMSTVPIGRPAAAQVVFPPTGGVGYRSAPVSPPTSMWPGRPIDEQMSFHERVRLLYVACTRARDHLVVSLHRKVRVNPPSSVARTNAELLLAGMGGLVDELPDAATPFERRDVLPSCDAHGPAAVRTVGGRTDERAGRRVPQYHGGGNGPDRRGEHSTARRTLTPGSRSVRGTSTCRHG